MAQNTAALQRDLARLQKQPLSIIKLSEPLTDPSKSAHSKSTSKRASTASNGDDITLQGTQNPSPSSLVLDLDHYRQLFKKLHFSYLEQVSKEKFLRAIVGDPPQVIDPSENAALEAELAKLKADLNTSKADVDALAGQLETQGRELAARYDNVQLQSTQLALLPDEISGLKERIAELEATADQNDKNNSQGSSDPRMQMPLGATYEALDARRSEIDDIDREITALKQALPGKARQIERLENEIKPLENQRATAVQGAEEARARKERRDGGDEDQIELRGRWYQGAREVAKEILGAEAKEGG